MSQPTNTQNSNATPLRHMRIPNELWDAAKTKAAAEGTNVSEKVRAYLAGDLDEQQAA